MLVQIYVFFDTRKLSENQSIKFILVISLAFKMDTDMPMKKLLLEFERIYKIYRELFEEYYKCFDRDGTNAVSVPGWEMHNLSANNTSMAMSIHWKLLKLRMLEQAYFQNPTDQELRNQGLKSRREFKKKC